MKQSKDRGIYMLSNFLLTLWKLGVVDDVERDFPGFYKIKTMWEKDYDEP